jgi:Rad52/22 family double-strand break repair protein
MAFSRKQVAALRRNVDQRHIRIRQSNGRELSYLEGWYVISQANRIFGFDGWSRETLESKCVLARENRGYFTAVYTAKVRLTVQAEGIAIVREGHGTGEGRGEYPGEVHDTALKAAETDATKRALITFGRPFGLELYRDSQAARQKQGAAALHSAGLSTSPAVPNRDQEAHAVDRAAKPAIATDRKVHCLHCPSRPPLSLSLLPSSRATTRPQSRVLQPIAAGSTIMTFTRRTPAFCGRQHGMQPRRS